ncbi:LysR family transcriptional regulator [Streptomyces sp. 15-116A]|uniref:LysR family transcriptional regulator n=1 Tax=Streptomyces sp. 15-116A TaxID=2259035 RepID=UPI0021B1FAD7|nr:LysR family transcriptional regulator [Streptomyces sp. 15-116A]MCT7350832.1 LysR family transcriptional regulator [Streptomyces sp. 15-116A]
MHTFITVYHKGSFTKAAAHLGITQPAVTQQIRGLEAELGKALFDRTPQGAVPTPEAEALAHDIEGPITGLTAAINRHFDTSPSNRPIRLGGPADLIAARVLPSLGRLIAGGLDLRITLGESDGLLDDLKAGHLDLVISTIQPRSRGLAGTALTDEEFALVASPEVADSLPPGSLTTEGGRTLAKLPMISYAESLPIIRRYWDIVFDGPPPGPPAVVVPDLRGAISAVVAGAGISVVPTYLCSEEIANGQLVMLLEPDIPPINTFHLAVRSGTLSDTRLSRLHAHLVAEARHWTSGRSDRSSRPVR